MEREGWHLQGGVEQLVVLVVLDGFLVQASFVNVQEVIAATVHSELDVTAAHARVCVAEAGLHICI